MIVCHCNRIQSACIQRCAKELVGADPCRRVTVAAVYQGLGKRPCCGGCLPLASQLIAEHLQGIVDGGAGDDIGAAGAVAAE